MFYVSSPIKPPKFIILWVFLIIIISFLALTKQFLDLVFTALLVSQILLLYIMFYLYVKYIQSMIQFSTLPISIKFEKINLSFNFKEPTFKYLADTHNLLMFNVYLHNDYYKNDFRYKNELNESIRHHINTVWKNTIVYFKKYDMYLVKILVYCFIFGLLILLLTSISYVSIDDDLYSETHKIIYKFFTFFSFSFWMYVTIIILSSEAIVERKEYKEFRYEIYTIYNNANISLRKQLQELSQRVDKIEKYIQYYVNISTSILYVSFLTILGIMF